VPHRTLIVPRSRPPCSDVLAPYPTPRFNFRFWPACSLPFSNLAPFFLRKGTELFFACGAKSPLIFFLLTRNSKTKVPPILRSFTWSSFSLYRPSRLVKHFTLAFSFPPISWHSPSAGLVCETIAEFLLPSFSLPTCSPFGLYPSPRPPS